MLTPVLSLADPVVNAEGSLDPLGLTSLADKIADIMLPGMTARMSWPRFLTAMAVASVVTESFDDWASDGVTPTYLVFEWYAIEAYAKSDSSRGNNLLRVPGIDKARTALREVSPMSARRYLKTPTVFGYHGVYKTLARALDIVDGELSLGENGRRLLRTWEREQKLEGFTDGNSGAGASLRKHLKIIVEDGIKNGHTVHNSRWRFFNDYLLPDKPGRDEGRLLWELLVNDSGGTRGEVYQLMRKPQIIAGFLHRAGLDEEAQLLNRMKRHASQKLDVCLSAIESYEKLCRILQNGFDWIRYISGCQADKPTHMADCSKNIAPLATKLRSAIKKTQPAIAALNSGLDTELDQLVAAFSHVRDSNDFFEALLTRHKNVQDNKPPEGKRQWFERTRDGGAIIRAFRLDDEPDGENYYVHRYRLAAVAAFVANLRGGA